MRAAGLECWVDGSVVSIFICCLFTVLFQCFSLNFFYIFSIVLYDTLAVCCRALGGATHLSYFILFIMIPCR